MGVNLTLMPVRVLRAVIEGDDMSDGPVHEMDAATCWEFLDAHEFGRLAYHLLGEAHIAPVNYCADDGALYFRTAAGSKLLGITMNNDVAFEVDNLLSASGTHSDGMATSVIVRGKAVELEGEEKRRAEQLPLRPWVPTQKSSIVRIEVTEVSGRTFELAKPWRHMQP